MGWNVNHSVEFADVHALHPTAPAIIFRDRGTEVDRCFYSRRASSPSTCMAADLIQRLRIMRGQVVAPLRHEADRLGVDYARLGSFQSGRMKWHVYPSG